MLSYGQLLMYYLIQASTSHESNPCFSKSSEKLAEMTDIFSDKNNENFCQQAFGKFSAYFGQFAGNYELTR